MTNPFIAEQPFKAIPTFYQGHHFRSRLEARWAVVFDALETPWVYEPQGFFLPHRLGLKECSDAQPISYLPDFWLPKLQLWVEVKGGPFTDEVLHKMSCCAAALSAPFGGCEDKDWSDTSPRGGYDTLLCGALVKHLTYHAFLLHMHKGTLLMKGFPGPHECDGAEVCEDWGYANFSLMRDFLCGFELPVGSRRINQNSKWAYAIKEGMAARFEYGQSGAAQ